MKAFKRMLAMLAVIAITVSGFAFAEDPAPVAEVSEIVIEATTEESPEAIEEAAEEVPAAEPAAEADVQAGEVAAEPVSEEADMPETIDAPVVYSLFHRDEVPGNCPHTNEQFTGEGRWGIEVLATDAKTHTIRYTGEDYYYCPDCGYEYYLSIDGYRETTESHKWSGDWCWECGYVNPCDHANRQVKDSYFSDETVISTDAKTHTLNAYVTRYYECPDCGMSEYEYPEESEIFTEAHEWMDDGRCWACNAQNSCAHPNRSIQHENYADQKVLSTDAQTHTFSCRLETYFVCPDCGFDGWQFSDEVQTITEPHNWFDGECWLCGAANTCDHPNAVADPYTGQRNVKVISVSDAEHTIAYNECTYYNCPDCGADYEVVSPETITATEPHDWYNGVCDACNTRNSCAHANLELNNIGKIVQQLISYDEKQHTCVFIERSWFYCPDCEERSWEDGTETFTETEDHQWWGGECEFCPAVNSCTHANSYADYVSTSILEVLSVTADSHTIRYQEEICFICPDCGQEAWVLQDEILTKTEAHDWDEGECWDCGSLNTCVHGEKTEDYSHWEIVKVLSTTAVKHVAEVRDYTYYLCSDCGESVREDADATYTRSAAHEWTDDGRCYECNYRTECTHPVNIVSSYYYPMGNARQVDARTHTMNYCLNEETTCQDCGYYTSKRLATESRLENHGYNENGACEACGYESSCAHRNRETAEKRGYLGCEEKNSKAHIYAYSTYTLTFCADCGMELSRKDTGSMEEEDCHYFNYANLCIDCGYESSCSHASTEKARYEGVEVQPYDINSHIVISEDSAYITCRSCGGLLINCSSNKVADTRLEKHSFKNGQCTECGLYKVECVHQYDKNGKCKLCGEEQNVELEAIVLVKKLQMVVGDEYQLEPSLTPSNASVELKYSSSKSSIVSVSKNGLLSAKKAGEATITVKSGDVEASCVVTVVKAPTAIQLSRSNLVLRLNGSAQLVASLTPDDACADVLWTSSSFDTVSVDQNGLITAKQYGSAVITVSSEIDPNVKASCTVEVSDAVSEIDLGVEAITLAVKQEYQLKPVMEPELPDVEFSYSSSDAKVAAVSQSGEITAKKAGSAVITVTSDTGAEKSLTVTVMKAPSKVGISETKKTVGAGDSFQLTASVAEDCHTVLAWSSSNTKVATVDENGFVTTLKDGKANITVKTHNGKSAKCAVTVKKAPTEISLNETALALSVGETAELTATITKNSASVISWSCSGDAVSVADGAVTAVKVGTATVTATTGNGLSASCTVSVRPAPTHIVLNAEELRLSVKQTFALEASLMAGEEAAAGKLSYSSSNTKAATVNAEGMITAKKAGEAVITATAANGVSAACTLTVYAAPTKVSLNAKSATIGVGETFKLVPGYSSGEALTSFSYTTSNSKVASIEQLGDNCIVTALKAGKANITIKTHNGKSAKCAITVKAAPESISLNESVLVLGEGQGAELSVSMPKNTAAQIVWTSSSDAVTVENGSVTALKAGEAVITATTLNGLASASCAVTVQPAPTAILAEDVMLVVGEKYIASVELQAGDVRYEGACSVKLSSGRGVVTVNEETGLITAKKAGEAVVTLTAYNGVSADCTITVVAAPKSVKLSASKKTLAVGESFELTAKLSPVNAYTNGYTVSVDREGVVAVEGEDGSYTVTAVAAGKAKLTIAASNGKKASCTITVK